MDLKMGGQTFRDVKIPLLWGSRAVLTDKDGRVSVIDLGGDRPRLEILGDKCAPGVEFVPTVDGFSVLSEDKALYSYNPVEKTLTSTGLGLPECQIGRREIRVGSAHVTSSTFEGTQVGIAVTKDGIAMGAPLPLGLAKLDIRESA